MHPYRDHAGSARDDDRGDDRLLSAVVLACGAVRLAIAIAVGETFGTEATLAAMLAVLGGWGLVRRCD